MAARSAQVSGLEGASSALQGGDWITTLTGGLPEGTSLVLKRHGSLAVVFGVQPDLSHGDAGIHAPVGVAGLRYSERAGLITMLLGVALASASAQENANRTGRDSVVHDEGADSPGLGATIEYRHGAGERLIADLAMGVPFGQLFDCPFVFDFGLSAGFVETGSFAGGLVLRLAVPLTRWAQADAEAHLLYGGGDVQAGVTVLGGNRFFGRVAGVWNLGGLGFLTTVGVRL